MHMTRPLTPLEKDRARSWMRERRGELSQADLVSDIQGATGWTITRDRYSKYESGGTDFGRGVLDRFIAYWKTKGKSGPDLTPPAPITPPVDMADALSALASELAAARLEREVIRLERAAWVRGVVAVLRAYEDGQVPTELLDALATPLPEGARR